MFLTSLIKTQLKKKKKLYSHQWLTSMEASQLGCFTCLFFCCCFFFFFLNVLLTHCYDLNDVNSVLYMICYEFSPIYKYMYIFVMLHHND